MHRFINQGEQEPQIILPQSPDPSEPDTNVEPPPFPEIHRIRREEEQHEREY